MLSLLEAMDACRRRTKLKVRAVRYRSACHRRGMNVAFKYTVLTLSFSFLTHYTVATYIRPTLYIGRSGFFFLFLHSIYYLCPFAMLCEITVLHFDLHLYSHFLSFQHQLFTSCTFYIVHYCTVES